VAIIKFAGKLKVTGRLGRLIKYCSEKANEKDGYNLDPDQAHKQMLAVRQSWDKNNGVLAHHVVQSFAPGEVEPALANQIGRELAEKLPPVSRLRFIPIPTKIIFTIT